MNTEYLANPLNREKKKYKYYLRQFENFFKKLFIYIILFPLSLPFLIINYFFKNKFLFEDFFNQNAVVFIVFVFRQKKSIFLINIIDYHKVLSRFGFIFLLNNFSINLNLKKPKTISFINKKADYYFNPDYFLYFDHNLIEKKNNFVLPFYLTKNLYLKNQLNTYKKFRSKKKRFKIIFSGTTHEDWYKDLVFTDNNKKKFLNRCSVLDILKENYSKRILILDSYSKISELDDNNIDKDILILETNPKLLKREKSFSEKKHLELISESNFFLCMPGSSMPICYHLIETCMVGTVPILSYNNFLYPKFSNEEALFYFTKNELLSSINKALEMDLIEYELMKNKITSYYDVNLSPEGVYNKLKNKNNPVEIFTNFDHTSSGYRARRLK